MNGPDSRGLVNSLCQAFDCGRPHRARIALAQFPERLFHRRLMNRRQFLYGAGVLLALLFAPPTALSAADTPASASGAGRPNIDRIWLGHRSHDPGKLVVNWMTKEPGDSIVRFGRTAKYGTRSSGRQQHDDPPCRNPARRIRRRLSLLRSYRRSVVEGRGI